MGGGVRVCISTWCIQYTNAGVKKAAGPHDREKSETHSTFFIAAGLTSTSNDDLSEPKMRRSKEPVGSVKCMAQGKVAISEGSFVAVVTQYDLIKTV